MLHLLFLIGLNPNYAFPRKAINMDQVRQSEHENKLLALRSIAGLIPGLQLLNLDFAKAEDERKSYFCPALLCN